MLGKTVFFSSFLCAPCGGCAGEVVVEELPPLSPGLVGWVVPHLHHHHGELARLPAAAAAVHRRRDQARVGQRAAGHRPPEGGDSITGGRGDCKPRWRLGENGKVGPHGEQCIYILQ